MISTSLIKNNISKAASKADAVLQSNAGVILMLSAQICSTILATLGRVLRTNGSSGSDTKPIGTSEVWQLDISHQLFVLMASRYSSQ
jgi:hypothetical protein